MDFALPRHDSNPLTWNIWRAWVKVLMETPPGPTGGSGKEPPGCKWTVTLDQHVPPHQYSWSTSLVVQNSSQPTLDVSDTPSELQTPDFLQRKMHVGHSSSYHNIVLKIGQTTCPKGVYFSSLPVPGERTRRPLHAGKRSQIR